MQEKSKLKRKKKKKSALQCVLKVQANLITHSFPSQYLRASHQFWGKRKKEKKLAYAISNSYSSNGHHPALLVLLYMETVVGGVGGHRIKNPQDQLTLDSKHYTNTSSISSGLWQEKGGGGGSTVNVPSNTFTTSPIEGLIRSLL